MVKRKSQGCACRHSHSKFGKESLTFGYWFACTFWWKLSANSGNLRNIYVLTSLLNALHMLKRNKTMPSSMQIFARRWLMIFNNNFINAADLSISHDYSSAGSSHWHQCGAAQGHQGRRAPAGAAFAGQEARGGIVSSSWVSRETALQISCK